MKKVLISSLILSTLLYSQSIEIENDWKLLGAVDDIKSVNLFNDCVNSIWSYSDNSWKSYTQNKKEFDVISSGDGFWIKGNRNCNIDTTTNASVQVKNRDVNYLTDINGNALYTFDNDTLNTSNCSGDCKVKWPIFYPDNLTTDDRFSEITREDGDTQLALNSLPLYYFYLDTDSEVKGDFVANIWHLIKGVEIDNEFVKVSDDTTKLKYLTDDKGFTLYTFDNDEVDKSNCYDGCEDKWPVFYVENFTSSDDLNESDFKVIERDDLTKQISYQGKPLYYFFLDESANDLKGNLVKGLWDIVEFDSNK